MARMKIKFNNDLSCHNNDVVDEIRLEQGRSDPQ